MSAPGSIVPPSTAAGPIILGYVAGAHGLGGEVRIKLFHAESETLRKGAELTLTREGQTQVLRIERVSQTGPLARIAFAGVSTREAAEALVRSEVSVPREALPELGADEVYLADLVGLVAMEGDRKVGTIEAVLHHPSADCVRIREEDGVREVPLTEPYHIEIDLKERAVRFQHLLDFEKEAG